MTGEETKMTYQIENKHDLTGAMLVVRFPQEDLDE